MKIKYLVCVIVLLFALSSVAAPPAGRLPMAYKGSAAMRVDNTTYIDANRILMFVTNHGNFGRDLSDLFGYDYGTWFPYTGDTADIGGNIDKAGDFSPYYAGGLWIGAMDSLTAEKLVIVSEYSDEYVPGPMDDTLGIIINVLTADTTYDTTSFIDPISIDTLIDTTLADTIVNRTFMEDNPTFKVYKLFRDSLAGNPNQAYLDYLADAIGQGAPYLVTNEGDTIPDMIGDQMCWSVFNDADTAQHNNSSGETPPLGLEVRNTTFAFDRQGSLGNIVILRLQVFNKGDRYLKDCYFSIWSDPDLGSAGDDLVACDTTLGLGYVYNDSNNDSQYGDAPPALGIDFFQGPLVPGAPEDYALMWGDTIPGFKNLGMTSFNKYINGTDPDDAAETYNYMIGKNRDGTDYIYDGQVLKFVHTGDPVTGVGDLDEAPADRRWMQSTGPISFYPGDSTEILAAIIVGQGNTNLNSITVVKQLDDFAQQLYENGFNPPKPPVRPNVTLSQLHNEIILTWGDTSEVDPGDFEFEGYSVWQSPSASGPWTLLKTWDVINSYDKGLVDSLTSTSGLVIPDIKRDLTNSGLNYKYEISKDALLNEDLKDVTTYYFRVTAFSFGYYYKGKLVPNGDRFLESQTVVRAVPQDFLAGVHPVHDAKDIIPVNHVAGVSGGVISPVVLDPRKLTGDTYMITFEADTIEVFVADSTLDSTVVGPDTCSVFYIDSLSLWVAELCEHPFYTVDEYYVEQEIIYWNLFDTTTGDTLVWRETNQSGDELYFSFDGFQLIVEGPPVDFLSFQVVANASGPLDPPVAGAFDFANFPTGYDENDVPLRPGDDQQSAGDGRWGLHTADDGGTSGGGTRCCYADFLSRATRDGANFESIGTYDYEMRFTGSNDDPEVNGSYAIEWFNDYNVFWVPFELWNIGVGTPDSTSDDVRLVPFIIDDGDDNTFNLESYGSDADGTCMGDCEHSASGGDDDPYTDWVYWYNPVDMSPGEAGYLANEAEMIAGTYDGELVSSEVLARVVLMNWNGGKEPPFTQDLPELGTIFRLTTTKPNTPADTFTFTATPPNVVYSESELDAIKAVPNPFYMVGPYDPSPGSYQVCFHHLPEKCSIEIYNLGGDLIRTLEKDDPTTAIACWDILTEQGLPVSSGIYIYVVNAEGFGTKIGKMAVFVQDEVLDIY